MKNGERELIAVLDGAESGVSGDKYLGALLGLGASLATIKKVAKTVERTLPNTKRIEVSVLEEERGEIGAKLAKIETKETVDHRNGKIVRNAIQEASVKLELSNWARAFAIRTMDTLLQAESQVHGHKPEETTLHELGSADTQVDILGTAAMADELKLNEARWVSTPLAVGSGVAKFSGCAYPNPAPAVLEILRTHSFPIRGGSSEQTELTTPTGAAITVNLAKYTTESYPSMIPLLVGYGAGSRELAATANLLRITIGEALESDHGHDQMVVLETNLDDVTGEVIGFTMERLLSEGAKDVTVTPIYMKKNRPGHLLSVITDEAKAEKLANVVIHETGTLGVREIPVKRHICLRRELSVRTSHQGKPFTVRIKQARDGRGRLVQEKPESDDLRRVATQTGLSYKQASKLVLTGRKKSK